MKQRLLSLQQWPIIMTFAQAARTSSAQQLPLTPSFHKFHDAAFELLPSSSGGSDAILNRLQQLADAYPTYVTLTTTQKLYGLDDGQQQHSYAVIIQDKQATQDIQDHKRTDVSSSAQLELVESTSNNIKDVVDWFHHSIQNDDANASDGAASTKEEEEAVPSTTTTHADIILNAATIGSDKVIGLAEVMLQAANCESVKGSHDGGNSNAINFLSDRRLQCRNNLKDAGVGSKDVEWLANVVFTRRTIILSSAATHGGDAPHHHHGSLSLLWLGVACVGLFLTVAFMTVLTLKRKHRGRIWLEEEAKRQVAEVDYSSDFIQKDFTRELFSFDEELTVQLIEPSHNVILV